MTETFTYHKVDENTPKDRPLLMYWPEYGWYRALWFCEQFIISIDPYMTCDAQPTHWMEMPPEPTRG
jgi:hypothetical protein